MYRRRKIVFETEWFNLEEEYFPDPDSYQNQPYYRVNSPDGAIVLALTEADEIILVNQFRPAINQRTLEFPSGGVQDNETPEETVARELYEETGYTCKTMDYLGEGRACTDRINSRLYAFLGTGATREEGFQKTEDIEVVIVERGEFQDLVVSGQFQQFFALGLLVLADWKLGGEFARRRQGAGNQDEKTHDERTLG